MGREEGRKEGIKAAYLKAGMQHGYQRFNDVTLSQSAVCGERLEFFVLQQNKLAISELTISSSPPHTE